MCLYFIEYKKKGRDFCPVPLVHWAHCDHDTCPKMDTCHDRSGLSVIGHWTEATP